MRVPITVDFETEPIQPRPAYPPKPVGVGIAWPGKRPRYYAWGHPSGNNCTKAQAGKALREVWRSGKQILFHNAEFDLDVAYEAFGLAVPPWNIIEDTMFLGFLIDPYAKTLALKGNKAGEMGLVERFLGADRLGAETVLRDWIFDHVPGAKKAKTKWGMYIGSVPGDICAPYCIADIVLTRDVFKKIRPMLAASEVRAYEREKRLLPVLLRASRKGVKVNHRALIRGIEKVWEPAQEKVDGWIRKRLKAPNLDIDKRHQFADALEDADKLEEWVITKGGERSTSKENLELVLNDKSLLAVIAYRAKLINGMRTFARPWRVMADAGDGKIFTRFHQVAHEEVGRRFGARTGRLSTNPNFQNVPKEPQPIEGLPKALADLPALPYPRGWIVPEKGEILFDRDYNQQELRVLAHYVGGDLLAAYLKNPDMDVHTYMQRLINARLNTNYARKPIKNTGFGIMYGAGAPKTAIMIGCDVQEAKIIRNAYFAVLPGLDELNKSLRQRARAGEKVETWGGRLFKCEEPRLNDQGWEQTFEYKMLNTLIQGSSADITKEAWIRYDDMTNQSGDVLWTTHDEFLATCSKALVKERLSMLRESMHSVELSLEMTSSATTSLKSWAAMKKYREAA